MEAAPRFAGKVALVTGGGSGIGRSTALRLAREGACLAVMDVRADRAQIVCEEIEAMRGDALPVIGEATRPEDNARMVTAVLEAFGRLDVLITAAGIGAGGTVERFSDEEIGRVLAVDLESVLLASKYAIPAMRRNPGGAIVHISSIDGVRGSRNSVFSAAKGGVVGLTLSMAAAHAREGIRVNCVCPGVIATPLTAEWLADPRWREEVCSWHPAGRLGTAEEVAAAIVFLASEEASFITGAILPVDGGYAAAGRGW